MTPPRSPGGAAAELLAIVRAEVDAHLPSRAYEHEDTFGWHWFGPDRGKLWRHADLSFEPEDDDKTIVVMFSIRYLPQGSGGRTMAYGILPEAEHVRAACLALKRFVDWQVELNDAGALLTGVTDGDEPRPGNPEWEGDPR